MHDKFIFRTIEHTEIKQAVDIEQICFPPHEACSEKAMTERIAVAPEMFLVAIDKENGLVAGFLNGIATKEEAFRDEFFTDANLQDESGKNVMLLGLDVLPEYRGKGLATEIVRQYAAREMKNGRKKLILTCLAEKVTFYEKMGFINCGIADSTWGDEEWYEMSYNIS